MNAVAVDCRCDSTFAEEADGNPGRMMQLPWADPRLLATVAVIAPEDIGWIVNSPGVDAGFNMLANATQGRREIARNSTQKPRLQSAR
jgi:hypothetical protein